MLAGGKVIGTAVQPLQSPCNRVHEQLWNYSVMAMQRSALFRAWPTTIPKGLLGPKPDSEVNARTFAPSFRRMVTPGLRDRSWLLKLPAPEGEASASDAS